MPLDYILETKLTLNSQPYSISDDTIDNWSFWKFQDKVNRINIRNKKKTTKKDSISAESTMNMFRK